MSSTLLEQSRGVYTCQAAQQKAVLGGPADCATQHHVTGAVHAVSGVIVLLPTPFTPLLHLEGNGAHSDHSP